MSRRTHFDAAMDLFEEHTEHFHRKYLSKGRLPKNYVWRPFRFAVRDVLLGFLVVKHGRRDNLLVVDVCLTADPPQFPPLSGAQIVSSFILSEAFRCGGTMEIYFTKNVEGGRIPYSIYKLARHLGVDLKYLEEARITPAESREFYLALTGFSDEALVKIKQLSVEGRLTPERACYMVHHGVWSLEEMESILSGSNRPERIILGSSLPEQRRLYLHDLVHARVALLGSFLDRKLAFKERGDREAAIELEADERRFETSFDPRFFAKVYEPEETLPVPWINGSDMEVSEGDNLLVMIRPRTTDEFLLHFEEDLQRAVEMKKSYGSKKSNHFFILTPRDFEDLPEEKLEAFLKEAKKKKIGVMVCPETVTGLDADGMDRLERSRVIRQ